MVFSVIYSLYQCCIAQCSTLGFFSLLSIKSGELEQHKAAVVHG